MSDPIMEIQRTKIIVPVDIQKNLSLKNINSLLLISFWFVQKLRLANINHFYLSHLSLRSQTCYHQSWSSVILSSCVSKSHNECQTNQLYFVNHTSRHKTQEIFNFRCYAFIFNWQKLTLHFALVVKIQVHEFWHR